MDFNEIYLFAASYELTSVPKIYFRFLFFMLMMLICKPYEEATICSEDVTRGFSVLRSGLRKNSPEKFEKKERCLC